MKNKQKNKKQKQNENKEIIQVLGSSDDELERKTKARSDDNKPTQEMSWGDMSDNETVVLTNMGHPEENEWQIATNKKSKKTKTVNKSNNNNNQENTDKEQTTVPSKIGAPKMVNPYKTSQNLAWLHMLKRQQANRDLPTNIL
jgi:hypothetical protein